MRYMHASKYACHESCHEHNGSVNLETPHQFYSVDWVFTFWTCTFLRSVFYVICMSIMWTSLSYKINILIASEELKIVSLRNLDGNQIF